MKRTSGRILAFTLAFAMVAAMVPAIPVRAVESVNYIDEYGESQTCASATEVTSTLTECGEGWYVVNNTVEVAERITVTGDVSLILMNGYTLSVDTITKTLTYTT